MMRSKMLDRAEARGEIRGAERAYNNAMQMVRLFISGSNVEQIAEALNEEETIVRKRLVEASLIQE